MDSFTITLLVIMGLTLVAGLVKQFYRDKCLRHFQRFPVVLEKVSGLRVKGMLHARSTGIELIYHRNKKMATSKLSAGQLRQAAPAYKETSYLYYQYEYPQLQLIVRPVDELNEKELKRRNRQLRRAYHPGVFRRFIRSFFNTLKLLRNSLGEILDISLMQIQRKGKAGKVLKTQKESVSRLREELVESVGMSVDPMLERYLGHRVVFELLRNDLKEKYTGILKDYSSLFLEFMDVEFLLDEKTGPVKVDMLVPQKYGVVRHWAEENLSWVTQLQDRGLWVKDTH